MRRWFAAALLLALAPLAAQTRSRPEVTINHVYVVLDSATILAMETHPFLVNEFSHHRKTTTQSGSGRSWTGVYLFGERTYLELFPRGEQGGVGFSGLALGVEQLGAIDTVQAWLAARFGTRVNRTLVEGVRPSGKLPWFHSITVDHGRGDSLWQVNSWFMETHPEFFRGVQQDSTNPNDISQKRYLRRRYMPERMLREIVGLTMTLYPPVGEQLAAELETVGWRVERDGERGSYRAVGPGADIIVSPVPQGVPYGIREIRFALNRGPATTQSYVLGNSRLDVCAMTARWVIGTSLPPRADGCR